MLSSDQLCTYEYLALVLLACLAQEKEKQMFCLAHTNCTPQMAYSAHYQLQCSLSLETSITALFAWITHDAVGIAAIVKES